eukprot:scaffold32221_cov157-Isochrysis_galbana.AAC.3
MPITGINRGSPCAMPALLSRSPPRPARQTAARQKACAGRVSRRAPGVRSARACAPAADPVADPLGRCLYA